MRKYSITNCNVSSMLLCVVASCTVGLRATGFNDTDFDVWNMSHITVRGMQLDYPYNRGINIITFNPSECIARRFANFDIYGDPKAGRRLNDYIYNTPVHRGDWLLGVTQDRADGNLGPSLRRFKTLRILIDENNVFHNLGPFDKFLFKVRISADYANGTQSYWKLGNASSPHISHMSTTH